MGLLTSDDLSWMQDMQERILPGTIVIERYTSTRDPMGGMVNTWAAAGTVIGRIYPQNVRVYDEPLVGNQITSENRWYATLPMGTVVTAKDRLVASNRSFEVVRVNNSESYQTAVRCECVSYNEERRA